MSRITLSGNASGTGNFTLASPNSNTDRTLTLPDATGTVNVSGLANEVPAGSASAPAIYPTGDSNTGIFFPAADTVGVSTAGAERLRVDSAGNVGIGTSSPTNLLAVSGTGAAMDITDTTRNLRTGVSAAGTTFGYLTMTTNHALTFGTNNTERMRIDSDGNLLVGKTATGTVGAGMYVDNGQLGITRVTGASSGSAAAIFRRQEDGDLCSFNRAGTQVGRISVTSTTTTYNTSSDYRLKEDVQPMVGASARLMDLKPVNFAWKVDGSRVDGFLAHEAQAVVPEAVVGEKDAVDAGGNPVYQGIDQSKLVPLLTAALQEALNEIASMKARITALEAN